MFLFTTNGSSEAAATVPAQAAPVSRALQNAASESGVSFDYLLRTANRESSLNPTAQARTSSAKGLFQFVEQTWLGLVKTEGHRVGLTNAAMYIEETSPGRFSVADPAARQAILDMRKDPELSARMAGIFTTRNKESLTRAIGREPNAGELYIAHFMGAGGAGAMIRLAATNPDAPAASYFPDAAAANRSIFYADGRAKSTAEVYTQLVSKHGGTAPATTLPPLEQAYAAGGEVSVDMDANGAWSGFHGNKGGRGGLFDLYRSDGAPVAESIERVWTKRPGAASAGEGFALRSTLPPDPAPAIGAPISLSPAAPADKPRKPKPIADAAEGPARNGGKVGEPLDLLQFMRLKG